MQKDHINLYLSKTNKGTLISQIPQNYKDYLYIPIEVEIDVHQLLNEPYGSALLDQILNDYPKFTKKLSQALSSLLHSSSIHIPERLLYVYPTMKHFPFFEVPLGDHEYKHYLLSKKRGKLINFNFIQVLKVFPPECYLWLQIYSKKCLCEEKEGISFLKNCFLSILRKNYGNLKENYKKKILQCKQCLSYMVEEEKNRIYMNCQKVQVYVKELKKKTLELWLVDKFVGKFPVGAKFNGACYYDQNVKYSVQNNRMLGITEEYLQLVSPNFAGNCLNIEFFKEIMSKFNIVTYEKMNNQEMLSDFKLDHEKTEKNSIDILVENWLSFHQIANLFGTNTLPPDLYLAFRITIMASIFLKNRDYIKNYPNFPEKIICSSFEPSSFPTIIDEYNMHVFIMADYETIIFDSIIEFTKKINNIGVWPYYSDDESLLDFLLSVQNGIILINNVQRLKKNELYFISKILRREEIELGGVKVSLNCVVWCIGDTIISAKKAKNNDKTEILTIKDFVAIDCFDNFDVVLDLTRKNNQTKKINHNFDFTYTDFFLQKFQTTTVTKNYFNMDSLISRQNIRIPTQNKDFNFSREDFKKNYSKNDSSFLNENSFDQNFKQELYLSPNNILQRYFQIARKAKTYSIGNYNSLRKLTMALSILRNFFLIKKQNKLFLKKEVKFDEIDVIVGIMIDEMSTASKFKENSYSNNAVVFGTVKNSKIGNFFMGLDLEELEKEKEVLTKREKEKKGFLEIYGEILELCCKRGNMANN